MSGEGGQAVLHAIHSEGLQHGADAFPGPEQQLQCGGELHHVQGESQHRPGHGHAPGSPGAQHQVSPGVVSV